MALSVAFVRSAPAGRHADGNSLYLFVQPAWIRSWVQRVVIRGCRRELGLGVAGLVTLAEARELALANVKSYQRSCSLRAGRPAGPPRAVCRYALRPPIAQDRLELTAGGQVQLELRRPWSDGTTHLLFDPRGTAAGAGDPPARPARPPPRPFLLDGVATAGRDDQILVDTRS